MNENEIKSGNKFFTWVWFFFCFRFCYYFRDKFWTDLWKTRKILFGDYTLTTSITVICSHRLDRIDWVVGGSASTPRLQTNCEFSKTRWHNTEVQQQTRMLNRHARAGVIFLVTLGTIGISHRTCILKNLVLAIDFEIESSRAPRNRIVFV